MENILPFLFLGAVYAAIGPSLAVARLHFLVFFVGRVVHSVAYLLALPAPTRSVSYTVAQIPCVSMAVQILLAVAAYAWVQKIWGSLFFFFFILFVCFDKQEENSWTASWEVKHVSDCAIRGVRLHWSLAFKMFDIFISCFMN